MNRTNSEKRYPVLGSTFLKIVVGGIAILSIIGFAVSLYGTVYCEEYADVFYHSTPKEMLARVIGNPKYYNTERIGASAARKIFKVIHQLKYYFLPLTVLFGLQSVGSFVYLIAAAGRRRYTNDVVGSFLTRIPLDILLPSIPLSAFLIIAFFERVRIVPTDFSYGGAALLLIFGILCGVALMVVMMDIAVRLKQGKWWKNTIIYRLIRLICLFVKLVLNRLPVFIKSIFFMGLLFVGALFVIFLGRSASVLSVLLFLFAFAVLFVIVFYFSILLDTLLKGTDRLAKGKLDEKISASHMIGDFKKAAENLNSIGNGMNLAVAERMKSERFRTELITNVSHDIKTPLTSIINYSDLILSEECENEKIREYADVLARQSGKLKRLTEDLIEASKAANGMVTVNVVPMESSVLFGQMTGEYGEKLKERQLELIASAEDCVLLADGRLIWRIFDNLMNNVFKYAQAGTRVYLDCKQVDDYAQIVLRNTSREQLNISAEELMERFVRGDSARTSEGNGLGLSIARSFTELQRGSFKIEIDGDLFKAIVRIPLQK